MPFTWKPVRRRDRNCLCCRLPHDGRPVAGAGSPPMVLDEDNIIMADNFLCDGGLLNLIEQLQLADQADSSLMMQRKKLKPIVAKQVAAAAKARAQQVARCQSPGDRQANRPHIAPLEKDEIKLGKILGVGGFSQVHEVKSFDLSASTALSAHTSAMKRINSAGAIRAGSRPLVYTKEQRLARNFLAEHAVRYQGKEQGPQEGKRGKLIAREAVVPEDLVDFSDRTMDMTIDESSRPLDLDATSIASTRNRCEDCNGFNEEMCRYAMKHLKPSLLEDPERFANAAMDLASEAEILLCLDHPNIIKLRGLSARGPSSYKSGEYNAYFLIVDRLVDTLQDQVYKWRRQWKRLHRRVPAKNWTVKVGLARFVQGCLPSGHRRRKQEVLQRRRLSKSRLIFKEAIGDAASSEASMEAAGRTYVKEVPKGYLDRQLKALLVERLQVAYDIACAMEYLHEKRILYRDLKTANVGFDIRGNVKLFDFGLSRYLPTPSAEVGTEEAYPMSNVGTRRYTAPEVTEGRPYNLKADVYSFGVTLWEIMSMSSPRDHPGYGITGLVLDKQSLEVCSCWPMAVQSLVHQMLDPDFEKRPTMTHVRSTLHEILKVLLNPETSSDILDPTYDGSCTTTRFAPAPIHVPTGII